MQKEETNVDDQEFNVMYRKNYLEIYKFIRRRVADRELAEDVLQETFCVACKKWEVVRELSNPTGWLIETAKKKICELNKSLIKWRCEVELDTEEYTFREDGYEESELKLIVLKNLTEEEKQRFVRYAIKELSIAKMAEIENISENNMSVRISRLRKKIAKNISQDVYYAERKKSVVRNDKKQPRT